MLHDQGCLEHSLRNSSHKRAKTPPISPFAVSIKYGIQKKSGENYLDATAVRNAASVWLSKTTKGVFSVAYPEYTNLVVIR